MMSLDEALEAIAHAAEASEPLGAERAPLWSAHGRVLAEDVFSAVDLPSADYSAMDGYAVCASDFREGETTRLKVMGECRTGHPRRQLESGTCLRIFTGAHIPAGADSVVMQENTTRDGDQITFSVGPQVGDHVRRRGEDVARGALLLGKGTRLIAHQLGLLASAERTEVLVMRRPRVAILCTGDELRPFGSSYYGGQLAESNSIALSAMCADAGAEATVCPLVRDELLELEAGLKAAIARADLVMTVGGVSVGDHDLVRPAIEALGGEILFHKVAIKPGKPVLFARLDSTLILGLPGNPASAQVVFSLLGFPLLRRLVAEDRPSSVPRRAALTHDFSQKPGRRSFYRARLVGQEVTVLSNQASGATTSMAWANALVEMGEDVEAFSVGQIVPVWALSDL